MGMERVNEVVMLASKVIEVCRCIYIASSNAMGYHRALKRRRRVRMDSYSAYRKRRVREVAREVRKNGLEEEEDNEAAFWVELNLELKPGPCPSYDLSDRSK